jgi:putative PEP-CTERM system histidine kinase
MIGDIIILGSHLLAALLFGVLALHQLRRWADEPRHRPLVAAFAVISLWAVFLAFLDPDAIATRFAESARNLALLAFMHGLLKEAGEDDRQRAVKAVYAAVAGAIGVQIAVGGVTAQFRHLPLAFDALHWASQLLGLTIAAGALILVHNLYGQADPKSRAMLRLPTIALAAMWAFDLHLYTVGYMSPASGSDLVALRGPALVMLAPLFAFGLRGAPNWRFQLSRAATFQSVSLIAILIYLGAMISASWVAGMIGGDAGRSAKLALIGLATAIALAFMTSRQARASLRVFIAKHIFEHRYDYRREWARFTNTVGREQNGGAPLEERIIKGLADIAQAPGGLLLLVDAHDRLSAAARWNGTAALPASGEGAEALLRFVREHRYVLECDQLRDGVLAAKDRRVSVPGWLANLDQAWAGVPLIHAGRLLGLVVLDHPAFRRRLDWEDLDLFRTAGVQAASYLAEARGQQALADARRFDEFNRRFAFILHDIKNLVSQLSLVTRNAERHADNPEFRADMIATLQGSVTKMNALLARLSPGAPRVAETPRETAVAPVLEAVAAGKRHARPIIVTGDPALLAHADAEALEDAIGHLVQNGIDASPEDAPVGINYFESGGDVAIEVVDTGCGMSGDFVATRLFQPFVSTKEEGFGIGAHEARALILAMGGRVEVESAPGRGTCFTIYLPGAGERAATSERIRA